MLNARNFNDLLSITPESAIDEFKRKFHHPTHISFSDIDSFPNTYGLYFVYLENTILYIGKADTQKLRKRCKQYTNASSGGTLRKKIEKVLEINETNAIEYINNNLTANFVCIQDPSKISTLEEIAIWAFQPRLNAIKPNLFSYSNCRIDS